MSDSANTTAVPEVNATALPFNGTVVPTNPYLTPAQVEHIEALPQAEPVLGVQAALNEIREQARESNQDDLLAKLKVAYDAVEVLSKRLTELEALCAKNFGKIKENTRLLN